MKISPPSENPVTASNSSAAQAAKNGPTASALAKAGATTSTQSAGVAVIVSNLARSLDASKTQGSADVDLGKVNAVRSAIAEGSYVVNPEAIADKLLSGAEEMLSRKPV